MSTPTPFVVPDDAHIPAELRQIADSVKNGGHSATTVRTLLSWFWGSQRRGRFIVTVIRRALDALDLQTDPDFDMTYLDGSIEFKPKTELKRVVSTATVPIEVRSTHSIDAVLVGPESAIKASERTHIDSIYRIGRLEIANRLPVTVSPQATITEAITIMLKNDYSQLPVMVGEREVKGLLSWRSLGSRLSFGHKCDVAADALENYASVQLDESLFDAISLMTKHDCILVRDGINKVCGILTPYDISVTFGQLAEPFLVLGEIENHIRALIDGKFSKDELTLFRDQADSSRQVETVADLTLGECLRLIENPERWNRVSLPVDRVTFVKDVDEVRRIRNEVMHFDPEGIEDDDVRKLRAFVQFLKRLELLRS